MEEEEEVESLWREQRASEKGVQSPKGEHKESGGAGERNKVVL